MHATQLGGGHTHTSQGAAAASCTVNATFALFSCWRWSLAVKTVLDSAAADGRIRSTMHDSRQPTENFHSYKATSIVQVQHMCRIEGQKYAFTAAAARRYT